MGKTQNERVLDYIRVYGSITPLEAMRDLGVMRLAARVSDLKRQGYNIVGSTEVVKNRFGEDCRVAKYEIAHNAI